MTGSLKQMVLVWAVVFGLFAFVSAISAEEPEPQPTFAEFLAHPARFEAVGARIPARTVFSSVWWRADQGWTRPRRIA